MTDLLIDGPYLQEQSAMLRWRGSKNQRVHFLTDAYRHLRNEDEEKQTEVEFSVGSSGFVTSGIWPPGFLEKLEEVLRK
jgi:anaerobic ribonucleoside-triphosphate reductase activating protein